MPPKTLDAVTEIEAKLTSDVPATQLSSDLLADRFTDELVAGSNYFQVIAIPSARRSAAGGDPNSNVFEFDVPLEVRVLHRLADPAAERAFTRSPLFTLLQNKLLDSAFWKTASVAAVAVDPSVTFPDDLERLRDAISVTLSVVVTVRE